jgi:hypothetical protein
LNRQSRYNLLSAEEVLADCLQAKVTPHAA